MAAADRGVEGRVPLELGCARTGGFDRAGCAEPEGENGLGAGGMRNGGFIHGQDPKAPLSRSECGRSESARSDSRQGEIDEGALGWRIEAVYELMPRGAVRRCGGAHVFLGRLIGIGDGHHAAGAKQVVCSCVDFGLVPWEDWSWWTAMALSLPAMSC